MINTVFFDIETAALPIGEIEHLKPEFRAPANYKNPDAIRANLMEQEAKWLADGALSALTGRMLCIGVMDQAGSMTLFDGPTEQQTLEAFLTFTAEHIQAGGKLVGFCCKTFDWPFILRRCWCHGLHEPLCLWEGRYLSSQFIDVAERWACGGREPRDRISLDHLSKFLGTGQKNGDGADFAKLWATDRPKAIEYLRQDLTLTRLAYERLYNAPI